MRADKYFAFRFGSRTKAAEALKKGCVLRGGRALSPSEEVTEGDAFTFVAPRESFVSNGGYKLSRALEAFGAEVSGGVFVDLGASTGGFTDCLLQNGAKRVYCVDVGESQLAREISDDPRVVVRDRTNARYLSGRDFPEPIDGVVSDLSFISLRLVLPSVSSMLSAGGRAFVLVKPQFEAGREKIGKNGIVPIRYHAEVLRAVYERAESLSLAPVSVVNAPIREKKNVEYIALLVKEGRKIPFQDFASRAARRFEETEDARFFRANF